jgi:hypothetical protein
MIIAAGAAALIAMTAHSPFGEAERPTGRWLPYLRLGTAAGMTAVAVGLLQLGVVGMGLNEGVLLLARSVIGFTGLGLLCSLVTGGLLAWTLPLGYGVLPVRAAGVLDVAVDRAGPRARRPRRVDLRVPVPGGRSAAVYHPRSAHRPECRRRLSRRDGVRAGNGPSPADAEPGTAGGRPAGAGPPGT